MSERAVVSMGVAASIGPAMTAQLAPFAEEAGFHALWVNDTPGSDALTVLAQAARTTERLTLATGVLPMDRRTATEIIAQVLALGLPQDRLVVGIGSGQASTGAMARVRDAVAELREGLESRIVVGALGPRMRQLAVAESDGVLLSWLTPEHAREQAAAAHATQRGAHAALYVRTALDADAQTRLQGETAAYAGYPSYAANFARLHMDPSDTVLNGATVPISERLASYRRETDEVVLRAITPHDRLEDYRLFIDRARPLLAGS